MHHKAGLRLIIAPICSPSSFPRSRESGIREGAYKTPRIPVCAGKTTPGRFHR